MSQGARSVEPVLHEPIEYATAIQLGYLESGPLRETIAALASKAMWRDLWNLADSLSREVSVLFDKDGRIWVDIGTSGKVRLSPPIGASIPFSLWIHTHPWDAYWSDTDLATLACYSGILDEALVLGHDHMKRTGEAEGDCDRLGPTHPLLGWTEEPVRSYEEVGD